MEWHVKRHRGDRNAMDALNRVCGAVLAAKDAADVPRIEPGLCGIEVVAYRPEELARIERKHSQERDSVDLATVLRFQDRQFALDGTKRINFAVNRGLGRSVILISVR